MNDFKAIVAKIFLLLRGDHREWSELKAMAFRMCLYLLGTGIFLLVQIVQFVYLVHLGFEKVYAPMSAAPGARDGAGLLIVVPGVLFGAGVVAVVIGVIEVKLIQLVFPDWSPPDLNV